MSPQSNTFEKSLILFFGKFSESPLFFDKIVFRVKFKLDPIMENKGNFASHLTPKEGNSSFSPCPLLSVIRANEFGMIVESNRAFEIGEAMNLGFHVSRCPGYDSDSCFLCAESVVVDSQPLHCFNDERFRVTLLYSKISARDRAAIISLSDQPRRKMKHSSLGLN